MICKYCGKEIEEGSVFCGYCGKKQPQVKCCVKCDREIGLDDKWCGYCGADQTSEYETESHKEKVGNINESFIDKSEDHSLSDSSTNGNISLKSTTAEDVSIDGIDLDGAVENCVTKSMQVDTDSQGVLKNDENSDVSNTEEYTMIKNRNIILFFIIPFIAVICAITGYYLGSSTKDSPTQNSEVPTDSTTMLTPEEQNVNDTPEVLDVMSIDDLIESFEVSKRSALLSEYDSKAIFEENKEFYINLAKKYGLQMIDYSVCNGDDKYSYVADLYKNSSVDINTIGGYPDFSPIDSLSAYVVMHGGEIYVYSKEIFNFLCAELQKKYGKLREGTSFGYPILYYSDDKAYDFEVSDGYGAPYYVRVRKLGESLDESDS